MQKLYTLPLIAAALLLAGCDKDARTIEQKEERNPLVKTGQAYMDIKDWEKAEDAFKQAIENEPRMARPHLHLATIYQQHKINYIHAIYHYDRYLELRPDSQKKQFINDQKLRVAQALANTLINNSPEVKQVVSQLQVLQRENAELKKKLSGGQPRTAPKQASPKAAAKTAAPKPATTSPKSTATSHKIYHVAAGDNLTKIAQKFYGNGNWEPIYQANKDRMKGPGDLRVGQTLVIPAAGQ